MAFPARLALNATYALIGKVALYVPPGGGDPIPCRVMRDSGDRQVEFGESRVSARGEKLCVRSSEVASPMKDGVITINPGTAAAEVLRIVDKPRSSDPERLEWTFTAAP